MRNFTRFFIFIILMGIPLLCSSWELWDKAKSAVKDMLNGEDEVVNSLIEAKLDTLEATVKVLKSYKRLGNQKHAEIVYLHLRLVKELKYCLEGEGYGSGTSHNKTELNNNRFNEYTGGWGGGHPHNRNWVSVFVPYKESFDYEYTDIVYPFDESNALPTASSNADDIMNGLLR